LAQKEGIQKEQSDKTKNEPTTGSKKGSPWLWITLGMMFAAIILGLSHGLYLRAVSGAVSNVHVNGIEYHYYDPQTGANWTYSMPGNYSMATGSSVNGTYPFTSSLNCSMTFTNASALTPGFIYQVHNLPLTFFPYTPTNFNITIIAPSYPYTGPLDVKIYVYYTC
jgi:hypothetical protein